MLEAADAIGGGTRSSELTLPGLVHDECSAAHPLAVDTPFSRRFDLAAHGLTWRWPEIEYSHPLDGERGAAAYRSVDETAAALGKDGKRWASMFGALAERFDDITADFLRPMLHVPAHPLAADPLRPLLRAPRAAAGTPVVRPRRGGPCSPASRRTRFGRSPRRCHRRSGSPSVRPPIATAGRWPRAGRGRSAAPWPRCSRSSAASSRRECEWIRSSSSARPTS